MESERGTGAKRRRLAAFARRWDLFAAFLLGGAATATAVHFHPALVEVLVAESPEEPGSDILVREGPTGLLNPLIECDSFRSGPLLLPITAQLDALVDRLRDEGRVTAASVYFRDLANGPWCGVNERDLYRPGSLLKVPLLIACLRQLERDPGFFSRQVVFTGQVADERALDPQLVQPPEPLVPGRAYSVEELLVRMTRFSDNFSTELLNRTVDPTVASRVYSDLGIDIAELARRGTTLSTIDYSRFFRVLYNASYLTRDHSHQALALLTESEFREGLVAGVPAGITVSHKFGEKGEIDAKGEAHLQLHDCGIVYHPVKPYCLCVMTTGSDYRSMAAAIADVSRAVFQEVDLLVAKHLDRSAKPSVP